jgi:hypothetical protein
MFGGAHFVAEAFEATENEREKLCTRIDARLKTEDVPWDWQMFDGTTSDALIDAARLADILVMSLDSPGAAGTVSSEDVVYMLERARIATGMDLDQLVESSAWLSEVIGRKLPGMVAQAPRFPGNTSTKQLAEAKEA